MKIFLEVVCRTSNVNVEAKNDLKLKTNVKYLSFFVLKEVHSAVS